VGIVTISFIIPYIKGFMVLIQSELSVNVTSFNFLRPIAAVTCRINNVIWTPLTNVSHRPKYLACAFFLLDIMENINRRDFTGFSFLLKTLLSPLKSCNTCLKTMAQSYDEERLLSL